MIEVLKFSRPGCMPCRALTNYISDIDLEALGASITEINTADLTDSELEALNITGVPVLQFKRNGLEVHRLTGLRPVDEIIDAIEYSKVVR